MCCFRLDGSLPLATVEGALPCRSACALFLPKAWTGDPGRCAAAGAPENKCEPRAKPEVALAETGRIIAAGVRFGRVLADAGCGLSAPLRQGLSARGLTWSVGIARQETCATGAKPVRPSAGRRRPRKPPAPSEAGQDAAAALAGRPWRRIAWRQGAKGMLAARSTALRVRAADGPSVREGKHLPGGEAWLVGEWRSSGERKHCLSNQPPRASPRTLAATIKARRAREQAHQHLKQDLGLGAFEGRSWAGLRRHAAIARIAFARLQRLRLKAVAERGESYGNDVLPELQQASSDHGKIAFGTRWISSVLARTRHSWLGRPPDVATECPMQYDYVPMPRRKPLRWPNGKRLAVMITINLEFWDSVKDSPKPYYPGGPGIVGGDLPGNVYDNPNYTWREYGQRVGIWRMIDAFDAAGVPATCTMNAKMGLERRAVIDAALERGWEILAHNYVQSDLLTDYTFDEAKEREVIRDTLRVYREVCGRPARGWLSSSLRSTPNTADILAEEGLLFMTDLLNDDQPYLIQTRSGRELVSVSYTSEVNDFTVFMRQGMDVNGAFGVFKEQFDCLYEESAASGRFMNVGLHPHVIGQPFRIRALKEFLAYVKTFDDAWFATREEIASWYVDNHRSHID